MPLLYATPTEVLNHPLGIALAPQLNALSTGTLDRLLFVASQRCNNHCNRRLQAPQATTVAAPGISAGSTTLPVSSTLGTDNKDEYAVRIGVGSTTEILDLGAGGVSPILPLSYPYPGTFQLASPVLYNHLAGEPVVGMYHEVRRAMSQSEEDIYEQVVTQQAQIASAHGGYDYMTADRTKIHWLWQYPLIQLLGMAHAYPYTSEYTNIDVSSLLIEPAMSRIRFPVGSFILSNGLIKALYIAGEVNVSDQIKEATMWYLRETLQAFVNPYGVVSQTMGKRSYSFGDAIKPPAIIQAECMLSDYVR